jgi:hypothetical protein
MVPDAFFDPDTFFYPPNNFQTYRLYQRGTIATVLHDLTVLTATERIQQFSERRGDNYNWKIRFPPQGPTFARRSGLFFADTSHGMAKHAPHKHWFSAKTVIDHAEAVDKG